MRPTVLAVLALLAAVFPASNAQDPSPAVRILEPAEGAIIGSSTVVVRVAATSVTLVDAALADPDAEDEAHLHYLVDGKGARAPYPDGHRTADPRFTVTGLRPGPHTITVELRDREHAALGPAARATVNVTVAEDAPYIAFDRPEPGKRTEGRPTSAAVRVERAGGFLLQTVTVRWTLDGSEIPGSGANAADVPAATGPGVRHLRAELVRGGSPLSPPAYDEVWLDVPAAAWASAPELGVAGMEEPAQVAFEVVLEGWPAEPTFEVRGVAGVDEVRGASFTVPLEVGEHRLVLRLLGVDGKPVFPVTALAHAIRVVPPPPEVRVVTPKEMATMTPTFWATAEVSNFTLGEGEARDVGHLHWYLDGKKVEDGTPTRVKFADLPLGRRVIEVRLADAAHREIGASVVRTVHVDTSPMAETPEEAAGEEGVPGAGVLAGVAACVFAALATRRRHGP